MAIKNYKMILEYDGSRYNGWQRQGNTKNTIQGRLEDILSKYLKQNIEIHGSGRTDAGVHAFGQVANFKADTSLFSGVNTVNQDTDFLMAELNSYLPEDIRIIELSEADNRFHARLNAKGKHYRYVLCLSEKKSVFFRKQMAVIPEAGRDINLSAMEEAAEKLMGEHNFQGFSDNRSNKSTVKNITCIDINREEHEKCDCLVFDFYGDGFLYHSVRLMVAALVCVGTEKLKPEIVDTVFSTGNRKLIPFLAPAEGLCLVEVTYG